jgi:predicted PurR-regulated permease PerM
MKNKRLMIIMLIATVLLILPLVAMQFTDEVNWTLIDFIVAGVLLYATGILIDLIIRKIKPRKYRVTVLIVLILAFFLIWTELAVGIF